MEDDFYRSTVQRRARELQAELTTDIDWWSDEPLGEAIERAVQQLVHTVNTQQWHLIEAFSQELVARLEAAEEAGRMNEGDITHYEAKLAGLRWSIEKGVERTGQQRRADAVARELLNG